ncbi:MAG: hypothetical protein ABR968_04420 [Bacteroidales bacterium]|jgi:tetratricopeptide (TPR) repeat protein
MKKSKEDSKTCKIINIIISIPFIFSLCYFIYYANIEKANASIEHNEKTTLTNSPPDSALIKLQAAIDLVTVSPNESNYINLSREYYYNGKFRECLDASKKSLFFNTNSYPAYNNMCCAYNQLGMWDEAIAAGKKAIEIKPGDQLATNNLKVSTDGKDKQDKSVSDAEALVKTKPDETNYMNLGYAYYLSQKYELAINAYQKVLIYNNKNSVAFNNICSAYNELGKWKEASENCEKALKIDSSFVLAKNNLIISKNNLKK